MKANLYPGNAFWHGGRQVWSDYTRFTNSHVQGTGSFSIWLHIMFKHWQTYEQYHQKTVWCVLLLHIQSLSEIPTLFQPRIKGTFNDFGAKSLFYVSFQFQKTLITMALKRHWTWEWPCVRASTSVLAQTGHRLQGSHMDPRPVWDEYCLTTGAQMEPMLVQILVPLLEQKYRLGDSAGPTWTEQFSLGDMKGLYRVYDSNLMLCMPMASRVVCRINQ